MNEVNYEAQNIIEAALETTYREASEELGLENVYASPNCEWVSEKLQKKLLENGIQAEVLNYHHGFEITSHEFVKSSELNTVIDPTWQQFLETPNPDLPKAIICSEQELMGTLSRYGIPERLHRIWKIPLEESTEKTS